VLEAGNLDEADREYLEVARRNARRLGVLIDDLLVVGQADVGATMMHPEPTEVAALVSDVLSMFNAVAHRGGVALVAETAPDLPPALVDPARTEQALTNLVGNALKFTPRGGEVRVTARHVATGADGGGRDGGAIEVLVADTGVGIEPAELGHIFERFYRSQSARDQSVKGTGLGLAIASSMIEAQGGASRWRARPVGGRPSRSPCPSPPSPPPAPERDERATTGRTRPDL
jgi:signal transduction histidine kinase